MPRFNVGDRVRCVNPGQGNRIELNEEYVILNVMGDDWVQVQNGWDVFSYRFELIDAAAPEPEREEHVGYYVLYREPSNGQLYPAAFTTERDAETDIQDMNGEYNWTVVAKKKIKTRI